ncbi:hypothetical protein D4R99_04850 [bacterium]|nr:MAG: hypothetical protein D4R99_04850 [bacterium]
MEPVFSFSPVTPFSFWFTLVSPPQGFALIADKDLLASMARVVLKEEQSDGEGLPLGLFHFVTPSPINLFIFGRNCGQRSLLKEEWSEAK